MPYTAQELFKKIWNLPSIDKMNREERIKYLDKMKQENHPKVFEQFKKDCPEFFEDFDDTKEDTNLLKLYNGGKGKSITEIAKITGLSEYQVKSRLIE